MNWNLLGRLRPGARDPDPGYPAPDRPLYAIGDIHGRLDLLERILSRIDADAQTQGFDEFDRVFLGDYIDRGPDSAGVLRRLRDLQKSGANIHCLMGNHERMCLDVLEGSATRDTWIMNGGLETLHSFSADLDDSTADLTQQANQAIGRDLRDWMAYLSLVWRSGDVVAVHATLLPSLAPDDHPPESLLWERPKPGYGMRPDGLWFVHGHTVTRPPTIDGRRIAIDTGAYFSEILTAAVIAPGRPVRFIDTASWP